MKIFVKTLTSRFKVLKYTCVYRQTAVCVGPPKKKYEEESI